VGNKITRPYKLLKIIKGVISSLRPSLGAGGTYPREGNPTRGYFRAPSSLGANSEKASKSLTLFGSRGGNPEIISSLRRLKKLTNSLK